MTIDSDVAVITWDPLRCQEAFHYRQTYYPLGFPVEVLSNSEFVLRAAEESWSLHSRQYEVEPVRLRIGVERVATPASEQLPIPVCRGYDNLISIIADPHNYSICDLQTGGAFGWVSETTVVQSGYFRYNFLEPAALVLLVAKYLTPIHGACVSYGGRGVLLCGDSAAGKSCLAFACARRGWTYTTDDGSYLIRESQDRTVVANPHVIRFRGSAKDLFPDLADQKITRRLNGEFGIELPTSNFPGLSISGSARVDYIVFLRRSPGASPRFRSLSASDVRMQFEQFICYGEERVCQQQRDSLDRLLTSNLLEFQYSDLDSAVNDLESLLQTSR